MLHEIQHILTYKHRREVGYSYNKTLEDIVRALGGTLGGRGYEYGSARLKTAEQVE